MNNVETEIKNIVYDEFKIIIAELESDFEKNFRKKGNNFLISQLGNDVTANMVFVSSFESKSGNAMEKCARKIARLRFGEENVPAIVNPHGIEHNLDPEKIDGQVVITPVDLENGDFTGKITAFRANNKGHGRGKNKKACGVTQDSIKQLLELNNVEEYRIEGFSKQPVDLAYRDGTTWVVMEIKAGGYLDDKNAPSNVERLLKIYTALNMPDSKAYYATLYHKDGEGNNWDCSAVKNNMAYPEMFLIGKQFWDKILPEGISYEHFTELYQKALKELELSKHIRELIDKYSS